MVARRRMFLRADSPSRYQSREGLCRFVRIAKIKNHGQVDVVKRPCPLSATVGDLCTKHARGEGVGYVEP
jgi:hypothetical protein